MRDRDTIDSELRRIALSRETIRARGGNPSLREVDELLDERLGHRVRAPAPAAVETRPAVARVITPTRRRHRRIARTVALPLSLVAAAAVLVVLIAHRSPHSAAPPAEGDAAEGSVKTGDAGGSAGAAAGGGGGGGSAGGGAEAPTAEPKVHTKKVVAVTTQQSSTLGTLFGGGKRKEVVKVAPDAAENV